MNSIERLVLQMIGENVDSPDIFIEGSDEMNQIRGAVNDAIEEIAMITGGYHETFLLPLRERRAFYRLDYRSGDIAWIAGARLQSNEYRLERTDLNRLRNFSPRWMYDAGNPRSYFAIGLDYVGFWPIPSTDSDIAELDLAIIPSRYTSHTDRLFVRKNLEWGAVHYAIGEYYASRGDARSAIEHHTRYSQIVGIDYPYMANRDYTYSIKSEKNPWPKGSE